MADSLSAPLCLLCGSESNLPPNEMQGHKHKVLEENGRENEQFGNICSVARQSQRQTPDSHKARLSQSRPLLRLSEPWTQKHSYDLVLSILLIAKL